MGTAGDGGTADGLAPGGCWAARGGYHFVERSARCAERCRLACQPRCESRDQPDQFRDNTLSSFTVARCSPLDRTPRCRDRREIRRNGSAGDIARATTHFATDSRSARVSGRVGRSRRKRTPARSNRGGSPSSGSDRLASDHRQIRQRCSKTRPETRPGARKVSVGTLQSKSFSGRGKPSVRRCSARRLKVARP